MALDGTPIIVKKKKVVGHGHHGGSWKVAYADFVTAMMAFFLTLWIMGLSDQTRTQVAGYFNDPMGYMKSIPYSRNIIKFPNMESPKPGESKAPGTQVATGPSKAEEEISKLNKSASQKIKALLAQTTVTWGKDGIRIEFADSTKLQFFEVGSPELEPDAIELVRALAPSLAAMNMTMSFEGYTDARPYTGAYDNFDLSSERASSLKRALESSGVPRKLVTGVLGYGDQKLKFPNSPYSAANRRVTVWLHHKFIPDKIVKTDDITIKKDARAAIAPYDTGILPAEPKIATK